MLLQDPLPGDSTVRQRKLIVFLLRLLDWAFVVATTSVRPPDLLRQPRVTISVPRRLTPAESAHCPGASSFVKRRLLSECGQHHWRHESVPVRVLMEQHGTDRVHHARDARPPGFASDRRNASQVLTNGSQREAMRTDDKLGRVALVVTELGLGVPNA